MQNTTMPISANAPMIDNTTITAVLCCNASEPNCENAPLIVSVDLLCVDVDNDNVDDDGADDGDDDDCSEDCSTIVVVEGSEYVTRGAGVGTFVDFGVGDRVVGDAVGDGEEDAVDAVGGEGVAFEPEAEVGDEIVFGEGVGTTVAADVPPAIVVVVVVVAVGPPVAIAVDNFVVVVDS